MRWSNKKTMAVAGAGIGAAFLARELCSSTRRQNRTIPPGQKIVVLGAGFAGMTAVQQLSRLLPAGQDCQITLVDQNNFLLFTPMLTEVASGELDARHIVASPGASRPVSILSRAWCTTWILATDRSF